MKKIVALLILILSFSCSKDDDGGVNVGGPTPDPDPTDPTVLQSDASTITPTDIKQTIGGFGAATVFRLNTPLGASDMDKLFGTGSGQIGLSILRIRVATDDFARGVELDHALLASARGAKIMATPWSPPADMKTNNDLVSGSLKPESYEDYANYLNDFAAYMVTIQVDLKTQ